MPAQIKNNKIANLERILFRANGIREEEFESYSAKITKIYGEFRDYTACKSVISPIEIAKELHEFLWSEFPNRYKEETFLLKEVIDNYLSMDGNQGIGNCLGLTQLYTLIGIRGNLDLSVSIQPRHIRSIIRTTDGKRCIEHCSDSCWDMIMNPSEEKGFERLVSVVYYSKGCIKSEEGNLKDAIRELKKAIESDPTYKSPLISIINQLADLQDFKKALKYANKLIDKTDEIGHNKSDAHILRGRIKECSGDREGALEDYEKAASVYKFIINGEAHYHKGRIKLDRKEFESALEEFKMSERGFSNDPIHYWSLMGQAYIQKEVQNFDECIQLCTKAIRKGKKINHDINNAQAYCLRGYVKSKIGNHRGAIRDLGIATGLDPCNKEIKTYFKEAKKAKRMQKKLE